MDIIRNRIKNGESVTKSEHKGEFIQESFDIPTRCPECNQSEITIEDNNVICTKCLCVIRSNMTTDSIMSELSYKSKEEELIPNIKSLVGINGYGVRANQLRNTFKYVGVPPDEKSIYKIYNEVLKKYNAHKDIINRHDRNNISKDMIVDTLSLYKIIVKLSKKRRNPLKSGIIAMCMYYIYKEKYIILTKKELSNIFEVPISSISGGNKVINYLCNSHPELRRRLNRIPVSIFDIVDKIKFKFESISNVDVKNINNILFSIKDLSVVKNNTAIPVVSGILKNYANVYKKKKITMNRIIKELSVSDSSVDRYSDYFQFAVYKKNFNIFDFDGNL